MIDASVAERAKTHPHLSADAQSLCWGSLYAASLLANVCTGYAIRAPAKGGIGARGVFALFAVTSLAMLVPAQLGWLGERRAVRRKKGERRVPLTARQRETRNAVFLSALAVCAVALTLGNLEAFYHAENAATVVGYTTLALAAMLVVALHTLLRRISLELANAAVFIFVGNALQPSTAVIFDWYHDDGKVRGNCARHCDLAGGANDDALRCGWARDRDYPCISPEYHGLVRGVARGFGLAPPQGVRMTPSPQSANSRARSRYSLSLSLSALLLSLFFPKWVFWRGAAVSRTRFHSIALT